MVRSIEIVSQYFKNRKTKNYRNFIDAICFTKYIKIVNGTRVFTLETDSNNHIVSKFSSLGLVFYIFWVVVYFYASYISFCEDQTILRSLYNTQLKHFGDVFERIAAITYVIYAMWKVPFNISLNHKYVQELLDIDRAIEKISVPIDHCKSARVIFISTALELVVSSAHFLTLWVTLKNLETDIRIEVMVMVALYEYVVIVTISHYYLYLILLKNRYKLINKLLRDIKERQAWEYTVLVRSKPRFVEKADELQDKYVCEKIKACARIYSMLYKAHKTAKLMFDFALLLTLSFCLLYIILYLFYLMEATASGLFHDSRRYLYFLVCVFWQIVYALGVIFLSIYFSVETVNEVSLKFSNIKTKLP